MTVGELLDSDSNIICSSAETNEACCSYGLSDLLRPPSKLTLDLKQQTILMKMTMTMGT